MASRWHEGKDDELPQYAFWLYLGQTEVRCWNSVFTRPVMWRRWCHGIAARQWKGSCGGGALFGGA